MLEKEMASKVIAIEQISDRLLMVKVQAEPFNMVIVQIYMPTSGHDDEKVDKMYEQLEELIERQKGSDNVIIMGDWNA